MEYFENYDEQLEKKLAAPETVIIPERYYDAEVEDKKLTTEELVAKNKRLSELKKVLAAQSLQDFSLTEINKQAEVSLQYSNQQIYQQQSQSKPYYNSFNMESDQLDLKSKYEQEKQAREHVKKK